VWAPASSSDTIENSLEVRFYIDPVTGAPHIHNHGVDEDEVAAVLEEPV